MKQSNHEALPAKPVLAPPPKVGIETLAKAKTSRPGAVHFMQQRFQKPIRIAVEVKRDQPETIRFSPVLDARLSSQPVQADDAIALIAHNVLDFAASFMQAKDRVSMSRCACGRRRHRRRVIYGPFSVDPKVLIEHEQCVMLPKRLKKLPSVLRFLVPIVLAPSYQDHDGWYLVEHLVSCPVCDRHASSTKDREWKLEFRCFRKFAKARWHGVILLEVKFFPNIFKLLPPEQSELIVSILTPPTSSAAPQVNHS